MPPAASVTSYCSVCSDDSTSGADVDDVIAVGRRKSQYACVDCDGDRMCSECACAHRRQRLSRGHQIVALDGVMTRSAAILRLTLYGLNCFCHNFVKFPPILIIFGTLIAERIDLCDVHLFSTSPNSRQRPTVLNADVPNAT